MLPLTVTDCTAISPYHPQDENSTTGYSELQLEKNRFQISFVGNQKIFRQNLKAYLLYRAAEVTRSAGYDYFITQDTMLSCEDLHSQPGYFYPSYNRYHYSPASAYPAFHNQHCAITTDILLFTGRKPQEQANAYQSIEIIRYLDRDLFRQVDNEKTRQD